MALYCLNFGFEDPFKKRHIFKEGGQVNPKKYADLVAEAEKTKETVKPEMEGLQSQAQIVLNRINKLIKDGELTDKKLSDIKTAITIYGNLVKKKEAKEINNNTFQTGLKKVNDMVKNLPINTQDIVYLYGILQTAEAILSRTEALGADLKVALLIGADNKYLDPKNIHDEFKVGDKYTIEFGFTHATKGTEAWKNAEQMEKAYGLHHMLPPEVINVVVIKTNGSQVNAIRNPENNKFYRADNLQKRVYVYQGDRISIVKRKDVHDHTKTEKQREDAIIDDMFADRKATAPTQEQIAAKERTRESKKEELARRDLDLDLARLAAKDVHAVDFRRKKKRTGLLSKRIELPAELQGHTREFFETELESMDFGTQANSALSELIQVTDRTDISAPVTMLAEIAEQAGLFNNKKQVDFIKFNHICQVVMGQPARKLKKGYLNKESIQSNGGVLDTYEELNKRNNVINMAQDIIVDMNNKIVNGKVKFKKRNGESVVIYNYKGTKLVKNNYSDLLAHIVAAEIKKKPPNGEAIDATRWYLYSDELLNGDGIEQPKINAMRNDLDRYEKFMTASYSLLEALPVLKSYEAKEITFQKDFEETEKVDTAREILTKVFNPNDDDPSVRSGKNREINMQNYDQRINETDDMLNRYMSSETAFNIIFAEITFIKNENTNTVKDANLVTLAQRFQELRANGVLFSYQDTEFMTENNIVKRVNNAETFTPENINNLDEIDIELIRRGMAFEQGFEYKKSKQETAKTKRGEIREILEGVEYGEHTKEVLKSIDAVGNFEPEELREIGENIEEAYYGTFTALYQQETIFDYSNTSPENPDPEITKESLLGLKYSSPPITIFKDEFGNEIKLSLGVSKGMLKEEVNFHAGIGYSKELGENKRWKVGAGLGTSLGKESGAGVGLGLKTSVALGEYQTITLNASGGLGVSTSGFGLKSLSISVSRDLDAVANKKLHLKYKEKEAELNAGLNAYMKLYAEQFKTMSPAQIAEFQNVLLEHYYRELKGETINEMNKLQFKGAGVVVLNVPGPWGMTVLPIPWIQLGIKGKEYRVYARPKDMPEMVDIGDERIAAELAKVGTSNGVKAVTVNANVSGRLELTEGGRKTISATRTDMKDKSLLKKLRNAEFEAINKRLATEGIQLEKVNVNNETKIRINIMNTEGLVNIFTDPKSGIETTAPEDGYVYLNWGHLESLSIRRVDEHYPYSKGREGGNQQTKIYISNNIHIKNTDIERDSGNDIAYYRSSREGTQLNSRSRERSTEILGESSYNNDTEMIAAGNEVEDWFEIENLAERNVAREMMRQALGSTPSKDINKTKVDALVKTFLEDPAHKNYDYRKLTTDPEYYGRMITDIKASTPGLSNKEMTYFIQEITTCSRAHAPESRKKLVNHILGWNKISLTEGLKKQGVNPEKASQIASSIMNYYAKTINELEAGQDIPTSKIPASSVVHTHIAYMDRKAKGTYMEFVHSPPGEGEAGIAGIADLSAEFLTGKNILNTKDAEIFVNASMEELSPSTSPYEIITSEIGIRLLSIADIVFGPENCDLLTKLMNQPPKTATNKLQEKYQAIWQQFLDTINELRNHGTYTINNPELGNITLHYTKQINMGLLEECRNFTTMLHEDLSFSIEKIGDVNAISATTRDYLTSQRMVKFHGAGVAGSASMTESYIPPTSTPIVPEGTDDGEPETETPTYTKNPGWRGSGGQTENPDENRGDETGGAGNEVPE